MFSRRTKAALLLSILALACTGLGATAIAQQREPRLALSVTPLGYAAKGRPLPIGAAPSLSISVRNAGTVRVGPLTLTVRASALKASEQPGWRLESGGLVTSIARLNPGERTERRLTLRVDSAPLAPATATVAVEARSDNVRGETEASLSVADCVGAFRERLATLPNGVLQAVRDAAEATRRHDPALPDARIFPAPARKGELTPAERLAATFLRHGGGDPEMKSEWFRFLIQRWVSELSLYSSQSANPGMCANNYYQVAGYRQGLLPITQRIDVIRAAAAQMREAARRAAGVEIAEDIEQMLQRLEPKADEAANGEPFRQLANMRPSGKIETSGPDRADALALIESAAWLTEAERRAQSLAASIDATLEAIRVAHKESCTCAF